jgi:hypothetical protein
VSSWTDAPIPWPRGVQIGIRSQPSLIVTRDLERAVRTESAESLKHWFGVSTWTAWKWRRSFIPGPGHVRTRGDRLTHRRISEAGADATRGVPLSDDVCDARAAAAKAAGRKPPNRWAATGWTAEQLALLGRVPDAELAARIGRTEEAVRRKRTAAGVPTHTDRRRAVDMTKSRGG